MHARGALLLILLLVGSVVVSAAEGAFSASRLTLPGPSDLTADVAALFLDDSHALTQLVIRAPEVWVERRDTGSVVVGDVRLGLPENRSARYRLTDVTVELAGPSSPNLGWLGAYFETPGTLTARANEADAEGRRLHLIGNGGTHVEDDPEPNVATYSQLIAPAHVALSVTGEATAQGASAIKLHGPMLRIRANENDTTIRTGSDLPSDKPGEVRQVWLLFELHPENTVSITATTPLQVAAHRAQGAWVGEAELAQAEGSFSSEGTSYTPANAIERIEGRFQGAWDAVDDGRRVLLAVQLSGDLVRTSMVAAPAPAGDAPIGGRWGLLAATLLVGAVLAAGGGLLYAKRARAPPPVSLEEMCDLANAAAEERRFPVALDWTRRAIALAPQSARLHINAGFFLKERGDVEGALAEYETASSLSEDGEADYLAATLLLATAGARAEIEARLVRALDRDPLLCLDIEEDSAFDRVRGAAWFQRAMARANQRLDAFGDREVA